MGRKPWQEIKAARADEPGAAEAHDQARRDHELGGRIRDLRMAAGMRQAELAALAGTSQPAIARLEAGGGTPKLDTLERVAAALDADLVVAIVPRTAA